MLAVKSAGWVLAVRFNTSSGPLNIRSLSAKPSAASARSNIRREASLLL
jgi:hypothetical protein